MAADTRGANLGLYLSQDVIIAAFVRSGRGPARVAAIGTTPAPHGSIEGATVRDPARVGQALRSLLKSLHSRASSASVVLPPSASSMRAMRLPHAPQKEHRALVRGELEQTGALPIGAGSFGFLWLPAPAEEERKEADVFAYYTDDATVDGVREALRAANLRLDTIEPYSVAAVRAYFAGQTDREPTAFLCPSPEHTDLCVHDGSSVRYLRRIPGGWEDMRYLRSEPPMSPEPPPVQGQVLVVVDDEPADADPLAEHGAAESRQDLSSSQAFLAAEVARSFAFYSREYRDADVPRSLVVLAPTAYAGDIARLLEPVLPIPVVGEDPSAPMSLPETSQGEQGALGHLAAVGVVANDALSVYPRVDTSRQEAIAISRRRAPNVLLMGMATSTVWMILSLMATIALMFMQASAEREGNRVSAELNAEWAKREAPQRSQELFSAARKAQLKVALPAGVVLSSIAEAYEPGTSITQVKIEPGRKVTIEGAAATPRDMQNFADHLARTKGVQNPVFDMMHQDANGELSFRIMGSCAGIGPEGGPGGGG